MVVAQKGEGVSESQDMEGIMLIYDFPPKLHHNCTIYCDGLIYPIVKGNIVPHGDLMVW